MSACADFRARLECALTGRPDGPDLTVLSWHEHLHGCEPCRALLEREEALEALLASLPAPTLPPDLARRVLASLERARRFEQAVDELLLLDRDVPMPEGLGGSILTGLSDRRDELDRQREERLDRVLARVPEPSIPVGLAGRVLAALEPQRVPAPEPLRRVAWSWVAVAAAVLAFLGALRWVGPPGHDGAGTDVVRLDPPTAAGDEEPPTEMLASLPVLENWDLLQDDDLDLLLAGMETVEDPLVAWDDRRIPEEPR